jgi:AbrB family looped-hinge helix DNA binding protein
MNNVHSAIVKVIKNGRITIPSEIREIEDIREGDYLKITLEKVEKPKQGTQYG